MSKIKKVSVAGSDIVLPGGHSVPFHVGLEIPAGAEALAPAWTGDGFFPLPCGKIVGVGEPYLYSGTTLEVEVWPEAPGAGAEPATP